MAWNQCFRVLGIYTALKLSNPAAVRDACFRVLGIYTALKQCGTLFAVHDSFRVLGIYTALKLVLLDIGNHVVLEYLEFTQLSNRLAEYRKRRGVLEYLEFTQLSNWESVIKPQLEF